MFWKSLGIAFVLFITVLSTAMVSPASTDIYWDDDKPCSIRGEVVDRLNRLFHEEQYAVGIVNESRVIEVFVSPESATWTILSTGVDGNTCVITTGEKWEIIGLGLGTDT